MYWNPDHSDDEEDASHEFSFGGRAGLLALIDCADYMFEKNDSGRCNFEEALEIVEAMMRNKIVSSERDLIGIVLYNTEHSPSRADDIEPETCSMIPQYSAVFMPLASPSAESIRIVQSCRESDDLFDFDRKYGHSKDSKLADVLWLCSRLFTRCGYKLEQSSIILFTSNEEPHPAGSYEYSQCFIKAKDLQQLGVNVVLVPMVHNFDGSKFYQEFLCTIAEEDPDSFHFPQYVESRDRLISRIFRRDFKKKALSHVKLQLSEGISIGVNIYSLSRKTRYPTKVTLLRDSNEIIASKRSYQVIPNDYDGSGEPAFKPILPGEQRKTHTFGGEKIAFSVEEVINMKQMLSPGLQLLGFKPLSKISPLNHLRSSLFLYPDEHTINGSTLLFRAMYEKCLVKQKAAFCMLTMRRKQPAKLIALIPQEGFYDDEGEPVRNSGFRIEFIPYAADIRKLEVFERSSPTVSEEQIDVFRSIVKKIKFKYHPAQFDNPVLLSLYTSIEALLFDKGDLEVFDSTRPDDDRIDKKVDSFVESITKLCGEDGSDAPKKRVKDSSADGPSAKALKPSVDIDAALIIESIQNGKTGGLLVATLRAYLQQQKVDGSSKMTKAALIDRIKKHHNL